MLKSNLTGFVHYQTIARSSSTTFNVYIISTIPIPILNRILKRNTRTSDGNNSNSQYYLRFIAEYQTALKQIPDFIAVDE